LNNAYAAVCYWVIWFLAIINFQVLKSAITFRLIGNLPLLFWFSLSLALCYVWSVDGPTCRRRISVLGRNAPIPDDKAACRRSSLSPPFFSRLLPPSLSHAHATVPSSPLIPRPNPNPVSFRGEPGVSGGGESRSGWRRRLEVVATETNPNLHISPPTLAPPATAADEWKLG